MNNIRINTIETSIRQLLSQRFHMIIEGTQIINKVATEINYKLYNMQLQKHRNQEIMTQKRHFKLHMVGFSTLLVSVMHHKKV